MAGKIKEIKTNDFTNEVLDKKLAVVDFYSTECPPCEALAPKYEALDRLYGDDISFVKIYRQGNRKLAEKLDVTSSPTVLFYRNGQITGDKLAGGIKRSDLMKNLNDLLPEDRAAVIQEGIKQIETETDVVVLGGGPAGLTAGIYLAQAHIKTILVDTALPGGNVATTHQVSNYPGFVEPQNGYMLSHFMSEQANKEAQKKAFANEKIEFLFEHEPREFKKHGTYDMGVVVENLKTKERKELRTNGIFAFAGFIPNIDIFKQSLELDNWGYLTTNDEMQTNIDGVYAVGDVKTKAYRQITTAVADGTIAAISITRTME